MKKLFTLCVVLLVSGVTGLFAQKLAHVNSQEILMQLPEVKTAEAYLVSKQKEAETDMQALQAEYQNKINDFQQMQQNPNALQTLVESKYNEIMTLEKTMQEFQSNKQV
jgi:outer membrane protein